MRVRLTGNRRTNKFGTHYRGDRFYQPPSQGRPQTREKALGMRVCASYGVSLLQVSIVLLGTFRSEDEDDYEYEFSVLSMRTSKNVGLQTLCACSVLKTRTRIRPRPPI